MKKAKRSKRAKQGEKGKRSLTSKKISKLRHEGVPQDQAVAMGINMTKEGRVGPRGGYKRSKRSSKRK